MSGDGREGPPFRGELPPAPLRPSSLPEPGEEAVAAALDRALDEALDATFPASDPLASFVFR